MAGVCALLAQSESVGVSGGYRLSRATYAGPTRGPTTSLRERQVFESSTGQNVLVTLEWKIFIRHPAAIVRHPAVRTGVKIVLGLGLTVGLVAYGVALVDAPHWLHAASATASYDDRLLVISVGGSLVVIVGLLYTARNYQLTRRGQLTDRFSQALERLGSDQPYVRVGGIRALEQIMRDAALHETDVYDVLAAFIRRQAPRTGDPEKTGNRPRSLTNSAGDPVDSLELDVQIALTVLSRRSSLRKHKIELGYVDLSGGKMCDANLTEVTLKGSDLSYADLTGADLHGAYLAGANFAFTILRGADLSNSHLTDAKFHFADLVGADLTNIFDLRTDFTYAWLGPNPRYVPKGWEVVDASTGWLFPSDDNDRVQRKAIHLQPFIVNASTAQEMRDRIRVVEALIDLNSAAQAPEDEQ